MTSVDLIAHARTLLEPHDALRADVARLAADQGWALALPTGSTARVAGWVDGALAREQTDVMTWASAVGACSPGEGFQSVAPAPVTAGFVAPVGRQVDPAANAVMAACEIGVTAALLAATTEGLVFIDGGLITSTLSVWAGLLLEDGPTLSLLLAVLEDLGVPAALERVVDGILAERVVALPKQDTAKGYAATWSSLWADDLGPSRAVLLAAQRDRPLVSALLAPGQWLWPRPAVEITHTRMNTDDAGRPAAALAHAVATQFDRIVEAAHAGLLHAAYVAPTHLPGRVVKVECAAAAAPHVAQVAAVVDAHTRGPVIREPFGQYEVDQVCKRLVTSGMSTLLGQARTSLGEGPATARYRT